MTKTFATAAAAIAIAAVMVGNAAAAPCAYKNGSSNGSVAPTYTQVQTYAPHYNNYGY